MRVTVNRTVSLATALEGWCICWQWEAGGEASNRTGDANCYEKVPIPLHPLSLAIPFIIFYCTLRLRASSLPLSCELVVDLLSLFCPWYWYGFIPAKYFYSYLFLIYTVCQVWTVVVLYCLTASPNDYDWFHRVHNYLYTRARARRGGGRGRTRRPSNSHITIYSQNPKQFRRILEFVKIYWCFLASST